MANNWDSFQASLSAGNCPKYKNVLLSALWWEAKGHWQQAYQLVDSLTTTDAAWVHAYLHRVEGDLANAQYWYQKAGQENPHYSLEHERKILVEYCMTN